MFPSKGEKIAQAKTKDSETWSLFGKTSFGGWPGDFNDTGKSAFPTQQATNKSKHDLGYKTGGLFGHTGSGFVSGVKTGAILAGSKTGGSLAGAMPCRMIKTVNQPTEEAKCSSSPAQSLDPVATSKPVTSNFRDADRKLFVDKEFADVTFLIQDVEIVAHKCILLTRCPSFGNMFISGMKESNASQIALHDFPADTFRAFLEYIYCGEVEPQNQDVAIDLLRCSDMYRLSGLKSQCEVYLRRKLSVDEAVNIIKAAEKYEAEELIDSAAEYIAKNFNKIFEEKYQPSDLSNNLLMRIFNKK